LKNAKYRRSGKEHSQENNSFRRDQLNVKIGTLHKEESHNYV